MEVAVKHTGSGHSRVVGVPEGGTVVGLKADALEEMFPGSIDASREAAAVAAHIEWCEEELDDAQRVADTGLEDGGAIQLVPRWPAVNAPSVYSSAHGEAVYRIALSRCGRLCAVGYFQGHVTVFDTRTSAVVADFTNGSEDRTDIAFSICGTRLACSGVNSICVWLTSTWVQVCMLDHDHNSVTSTAWTHCGRLVFGDSEGNLHVWDLKGTPSATVLGGRGHVLSIAASGTRIFTGSSDAIIRVWDITTLTLTHTLDDHTCRVNSVVLTKDEQHLVSCASNSLKVWCTATLSCLRTVHIGYLHSLAVSQPGDIVAVEGGRSVTLFRLSTCKHLGEVRTDGNGVALSLCGRWVFIPTDGGKTVTVCAVPSGSP